ncbi:MAG: sulfite reductase subunit C [Lachnospiraceae bacterium]|nr:sulfite reductase subunit C [Lachnospiraceae bacterium]
MDMNVKELKKNAFRQTKVRNVTSSRIRVPGGLLKAEYLGKIQEIAEKYGNGTVNLTSRQGFEIPGIPFEKIPEVNAALQEIIDGTGINQDGKERGEGYPASGTRNVAACVGNRVCPYACYDTTAFAQRIEKVIFPNDLHVKIVLTGCPNDCQKVRMADIGIMGMTEPQFDPNRCVSCGACEKRCKSKSVAAITMDKFRPVRDSIKCIGCGECVNACPNFAWTRSRQKYYRVTLMGRTGKKNPRMGVDFIKWADEESIIQMIKNMYAFTEHYINPNSPGGKEHVGYIVDRVGTEEFLKWLMKDVHLPAIAEVYTPLNWGGVEYAHNQYFGNNRYNPDGSIVTDFSEPAKKR